MASQKGCILLLQIIFIILLYPLLLVVKEGAKCERCESSIMEPNFVDLSDTISNPYSYKYRFFRYYEGWREEEEEDTTGCLPVIFVPGSAGNYRQVRSLASTVLTAPKAKTCFKFYTVDFMEEFVAFSARLLKQQAWYVNDAIKSLTGIFGHTDSTILVGHSFGGVVLRMIQTLDNYSLQEHRNFVITIASPHVRPPLEVSLDLDMLYDSLQDKAISLSIASGSADIQVPSRLSVVKDAKLKTVNLRAEKISKSSSNPNHTAMVWDKALLIRLATLFHRIAEKAVLLPEQSIRKYIEEDFFRPKDRLVASGPSVVCDTIIKYDLSRAMVGFQRSDICDGGERDERQQCIVIEHRGKFLVSTNEEYPEGLAVFATSSYTVQGDGRTLLLETSMIHRDRFPGKVRILPTITGSSTQHTEFNTRLKGDSPKNIILRYNCREIDEWNDTIYGWQDQFFEIRNSLLTKVMPSTAAAQDYVGVFGLLFGTSIVAEATELRLDIGGGLKKSISLSFYSTIPILSIAAYDEDRIGRYSMPYTGGRHEIVIEPDTHFLQVYFDSGQRTKLRITTNYWHSLILSLTDEPSKLLTELYAAAVLISADFVLWQMLVILVGRTLFFELLHGSVAIILATARALWIALICWVFMRAWSRRRPLYTLIDWRWILALLLIFLLPISTGLQVIAQMCLLIVGMRGFTAATITLLFALTPQILKSIFDIRNVCISMTEMGILATISNEASIKLLWSMASFIPVFELIVQAVVFSKSTADANKSERFTHGSTTSTSRIWSVILAIICYRGKPYFLPILHFTLLLAKVL